MPKVAFYTLGCKLNFSETSTIARDFVANGYQKVELEDKPDVFVINTCSVTENADKKCKALVNKANRLAPDAFVVIIGCYAQLKPEDIAETVYWIANRPAHVNINDVVIMPTAQANSTINIRKA